MPADALAFALTKDQQAALDLIRESPKRLLVIDGAAGTGKTTLLSIFAGGNPHAVTVAPTHAAAARLRRGGIPATTLYSQFFIPCGEVMLLAPIPGIPLQLDVWWATDTVKTAFRKAHGDKHWEPEYRAAFHAKRLKSRLLWELRDDRWAPLVLIDEFSMLPQQEFNAVVQMITSRGGRVIVFGDGFQLPSPSGSELALSPDYTLRQIVRSTDLIAAYGGLVREGQPKTPREFWRPQASFVEMLRGGEAVVIAWRNHDVFYINVVARRKFLDRHLKDPLGVDDRVVLCTTVSHDFVNATRAKIVERRPGAVFVLESADTGARLTARIDRVTVRHRALQEDLREINDELHFSARGHRSALTTDAAQAAYDALPEVHVEFGWALTAHRAQGADWAQVAVVDDRGALYHVNLKQPGATDATAERMMRRWYYTAITRAKTGLWICGSAAELRATIRDAELAVA